MNVETPVAKSFADLASWTTRAGTGLQDEIRQHGAVISVRQAGGPVDDIAGDYRCVIDVYAPKYAAMWNLAEQVEARLTRRWFRAGAVAIDKTICESSFTERPLSESTRVLTSTWVLTARHHTRLTTAP